jgi:hypothetical protein
MFAQPASKSKEISAISVNIFANMVNEQPIRDLIDEFNCPGYCFA